MLTSLEGSTLFAVYSLFIVTLVWFSSRRRGTSPDDFLVMKRELGIVRGSVSMAVSWIWAPAVFICSLQAYSQGLPGIFWFTFPNIICFFVFVPFALKMRKMMPSGYTVSQIFRHRFIEDNRPHKTAMIVAFGYQLGAIIINCVAGATLINLLSGIPYSTGVLLMGGLALAYSSISGLRASVLSDVAQMSMILIVACLIVPWVVNEAGGLSAINEGLGGHTGEFRDLLNPKVAYAFGIATTIGLISGPVADQMFSQRAFAAKEKSISKIFIIGGLLFGVVPIILSILGFIGAAEARSTGLQITDPQMVGPEVVGYFLPKWALMLFAIMAFAGLTSTLDSAFSAVGALTSIDLSESELHTNVDTRIRRARFGMVFFAFAGISIALLKPQLLWVFLIYGALASSVFIPIMLALFWKKLTSEAAFFAITTGILLGTPLSIYANVTSNTDLIVLSALIGLCLPGLVCVLISSQNQT